MKDEYCRFYFCKDNDNFIKYSFEYLVPSIGYKVNNPFLENGNRCVAWVNCSDNETEYNIEEFNKMLETVSSVWIPVWDDKNDSLDIGVFSNEEYNIFEIDPQHLGKSEISELIRIIISCDKEIAGIILDHTYDGILPFVEIKRRKYEYYQSFGEQPPSDMFNI